MLMFVSRRLILVIHRFELLVRVRFVSLEYTWKVGFVCPLILVVPLYISLCVSCVKTTHDSVSFHH